VKLGNPLPNPVITNQVQHAIRDRPQAACKPCRTPTPRLYSLLPLTFAPDCAKNDEGCEGQCPHAFAAAVFF
jgi:hypothetical protein